MNVAAAAAKACGNAGRAVAMLLLLLMRCSMLHWIMVL
jgi:hypothetical protein